MLSPRAAWALAIVATLTMTVSYVDRQALSVLAPVVTHDLHISEHQYGWLVATFSIAYLIGAPLSGRLIDRVGARRGLVGAVLLWSLVAAAHALVPGLLVLFALRFALGVAESPSFPGAAQTVHRALPPEQRSRGYGVLFTGSSIGAMFVAPLATWLNRHYHWQRAFVVTALVGLAWIPLWLAVAWRGPARAVLDSATRAESSAGRERLPWRAVVTHPGVLRAVALVAASAPAIGFVQAWGSKYLVGRFHLTQNDVGRYLWLPPLAFDVGAVLFGDLAGRRAQARNDGAPDRLLVATAAVLEAAIVGLALARTPWGSMAWASVCMFGGGGLYALATADMLARVPAGAVSTAGGMTAASQSLMLVLWNPLIGLAVERTRGYGFAVVVLGAWVLPGAAFWLLWDPRARAGRKG